MNADSPERRSTGMTSSDMRAIWPGALLVVYLAATALLLLLGRERVSATAIALHLAVLAAIAAATWLPSVPGWLRAWAPLMALLFLYSEMPALITAAGHQQLYDPTVIHWERAWFGGQPARDWARSWPSRVVSEPLHFAYLSYYALIVGVPAVLYAGKRRQDFETAVFVLMFTFVACFVTYIVFPVAGPRYIWPSAAPTGVFRAAATWLLESRSSQGTAFPSSHVAVAATQSILAWRYFGRRGIPVLLLTLGLATGAIYGGFHYAIDVVAGLAFAIVASAVALRLARRGPSAGYANAIAPT
jgi:membrane-associated phospholipid phosphatase